MKILLGMSGGLDSTYAAHKLLSEGHSVEGAILLMHGNVELTAARESAEGLKIPLRIIDCRERFEKYVVENFISEYLKGRTPNPCVVCNSEVKFRVLLDYALENGFDAIATGHYARIGRLGDRFCVRRAKDEKKDQTYMLWRLPQDVLSHLVLPLSDYEKREVREDAREVGLSAADREESQEICFVPDGDYAAFIEERTAPVPKGNFIDKDGNILGEHQGIIRYTVGQRKGLGIAVGQRIFVTDINAQNNTVTLSVDDSYRDTVLISGMVFSGICEPNPGEKISLSVKIRYLARPVPCTLEYLGGGNGRVTLEALQRAITPGQSAVFYREDNLICGGFIDVAL